MNRKVILRGILLAVASALAACGSGYDGGPPPVDPPPPPPQPVAFTQFVKDQFAATADDTDPVAVDGIEFSFADEDDPDAFDELLDDGNPRP